MLSYSPTRAARGCLVAIANLRQEVTGQSRRGREESARGPDNGLCNALTAVFMLGDGHTQWKETDLTFGVARARGKGQRGRTHEWTRITLRRRERGHAPARTAMKAEKARADCAHQHAEVIALRTNLKASSSKRSVANALNPPGRP